MRTAADPPAPFAVQHQTAEIGPTPAPAPITAPAAPVHPGMAAPPMTAGAAKAEPQAPGAALQEEPPDRAKTQTPIRSLALEFAPDGAGDIKVRLSERGGDVHISLHGTDPSLAGRVREGVGDLVGSLSKAGYDAEAWTPGEGRQERRRQSDERQFAPTSSGAANAEEFSGILQQPIQEVS